MSPSSGHRRRLRPASARSTGLTRAMSLRRRAETRPQPAAVEERSHTRHTHLGWAGHVLDTPAGAHVWGQSPATAGTAVANASLSVRCQLRVANVTASPKRVVWGGVASARTRPRRITSGAPAGGQ